MIPQEADQTHIEYGFPVLTRAASLRTKWSASGNELATHWQMKLLQAASCLSMTLMFEELRHLRL